MKILVVEDERITLKAIKLILECAGHEAIVAERSEVGFDLALSERPDLALVDLKMRDSAFDGLELIRRIRQCPPIQDLLLIAHTASVSPQSVAEARKAGANDVLRKPFRQAELVAIIDRNRG